jgi:mannose/fructose/N-acetylgalactosamine-specific phosphotransferase system component IIB
LIHGQVLEAWVPHLKIARLVVADDEAAGNALMRAAMTMAVPDSVEVRISKIDQTDFPAIAKDAVPTLVLLRDVMAAVTARRYGLPEGPLNVGNVHAGTGRSQVTRAVFLSPEETAELKNLGMLVTLQSVPSEAPVVLN